MTHELISRVLGVRREGITEAAGKLRRAGLVHLSRGHIAVLVRPGLEAQACECYAVVKREYDHLLCPLDTIRGAGGHIYVVPTANGMKSNSKLVANPLSAANRLLSAVPQEGQMRRRKGSHERLCAGH